MKRTITISATLLLSLGITGVVMGDEDERSLGGWYKESRLDVAPVNDTLYQSECGSCHFAYQPGLLPARSWEKLMGGLADHFGDNAELDAADHQHLLNLLKENAADKSKHKRSRHIAASIKEDEAPLRISDTLYFKRKHDEVPMRFVTGNKEVGSFSNCAACHTRAASGSYDEHQVRIPGVGRWDD